MTVALSMPAATSHAGSQPGHIVTIVAIEDDQLLRDAVHDTLRQQPDFRLRPFAADSSVAAQLALAESLANEGGGTPLVALLDVSLGERDSLLACSRLSRAAPTVRVVITGMTAPHAEIADFVSAGAVAFVMMDASAADFMWTIRQAARGKTVLPAALTPSLFAQITRERDRLMPAIIAESASLTVREREIIRLLGEGLSNRDIAERLHIAIHTVKSHVHNILEKLSLRSRLEVVALSRVLGTRYDGA